MKRNLSLLALATGMMFAAALPAAAAPDSNESSREREDNDERGSASDYTAFSDLSGVQKLKTGGIKYTFGALPGGGFGFSVVAVEPFRDGVKARLDTATGNVTYETPDGLRVTFTSADEVPGQSTPQARLFNKTNPSGGFFGGSLTTPVVSTVPLSYTRFGTFFATATPTTPFEGHAFVLGVPTEARDLPKRGTATYTSAVGGSAFTPGVNAPLQLTGSTATFSANFRTGAINTGINLVATPVTGGAPIALDTLTGTGSISGAKPGFTGSFTGTGSVTGSFAGAFFGPKAVEFGYDFLVGGTSAAGRTFTAIGGVAGSTAIAPPPPPPPPPPYTPFADLTGVQGFASVGVNYSVGPVPSGGFGFVHKAVELPGSGVAVQYDTATGNITFVAPNGLSTTFTAADEVVGQSTPTARLFNKPNPAGGAFGGSLTTPSISGVPLSYTRFATFFATNTPTGFDAHAVVFGVQTRADDVPTTGTATYTGGAGGSAILAAGGASVRVQGAASLTADFASGSITTTLALDMIPASGIASPLDTLTGVGGLGAVKPGFSGSLTGTGSVSGFFSGAFFGPQAAEFGFDFDAGGINAAGVGYTIVGGAAGRRP